MYRTSSSIASAAWRSWSESSAILAPSPATLPAATIRGSASFGTSPIRIALLGERYEPKEPASSTCWISVSAMPRSSTSSRHPVAIAAFANCSSRTSRWDRYTAPSTSPSPLAQWRTKIRVPSARAVRRETSSGSSRAASSCETKRPDLSSRPTRTSSAAASTRPEPQIPAGSVSPITSSSTAPSRSRTTSIAPSAARIPQAIWAASKAGPAGAAVQTTPSAEPRTTSQFVPTSIRSRRRRSRVIPVASMPATRSPPT